jgi:hypothetical protein
MIAGPGSPHSRHAYRLEEAITSKFPKRFGSDVRVREVDLDVEHVEAAGGRLTEARAAELASALESRRGRPSLTGPGRRSPALNLRISEEVRHDLDAVAQQQGRRASDVVRDALAEYLGAHRGA